MKLIRYTHPSYPYSHRKSRMSPAPGAFGPLLRAAIGGESNELSRPGYTSGIEWFEDGSNYYARIEVPGFKRDQIRLDAEGGLIRLACEAAGSNQTPGYGPRRLEQVLRHPEGVRLDGIEARLADGILHLTLPKEEVCKPVSITIH